VFDEKYETTRAARQKSREKVVEAVAKEMFQ